MEQSTQEREHQEAYISDPEAAAEQFDTTDVISEDSPETSQSQKPSRHFLKRLLLGTSLAATALVSGVAGAALMLSLPLPSAFSPTNDGTPPTLTELWRQNFGFHISRPINILVLGIDEVLGEPDATKDLFSGRSDTMLLVRIDPIANTASILSIPRDTQVRIPDYGVAKINHANIEGGPELAATVVSQTLNGVPIDRYVRVNTDAFRELVDLLGGVEVFVPKPMHYVDNTQKLTIDLEQGWQTLNGDQAEQFARFRQDAYGDIGRVQRQQQLINALRDRINNPAVLTKLPEAIELFQDYIDTNLSLEEMFALANFGLGLDQDHFRMVMLPGRFSSPSEYVASYWIMDPAGRDEVMQEYFAVNSLDPNFHAREIDRLRIAVQNATAEPQLANEVAGYLRDHGFNNVYLVHDWPDSQQQTQIIVQRGNLEGAAMVEDVLGVGSVVPASTGDLESDLTIRVGEDWVQRLGSES